jgi:mRNA interferase MazF
VVGRSTCVLWDEVDHRHSGWVLQILWSVRGVVTVVPITSNVTRVYPFQVRINRGISGLKGDSKAQAEQIRSVSVSRVDERVGRLNAELREQLDVALRLQFDL